MNRILGYHSTMTTAGAGAATLRSRASERLPRVRLVGTVGAIAAQGGGEIQLERTGAALVDAGVDARPWSPWEDGYTGFDCLHLFGSAPEQLPIAEAARRAGVAVVLSPIAWFDVASRWHSHLPLAQRVTGVAKAACRRYGPQQRDWRWRLYHGVDRLLPNSRAEAEQLERWFGVPGNKIHVVPNGADSRFAQAAPELFRQRFGEFRFVLCVGRVEPRKNQLALIRALRTTGTRLVLIGDPVAGHESYYQRCREEAGDVRFIGGIAHDDPLLASAYAAADAVVLVSWFETPGLAALEAGMSGTPLVLTERGSAREYFCSHAWYVAPGDLRQIRDAVEAASREPRSAALAGHVQRHYTWKSTAQLTKGAYAQAIQQH